MSLNSQTIILPRMGENLIAVVKCDSRGEEKDAMKSIMKAITEWVKTTYYGKIAWEHSAKDFNIADLSSVVYHTRSEECKSLISFLNDAGIYNLEIDIIGTGDYARDYTYDTVLADL